MRGVPDQSSETNNGRLLRVTSPAHGTNGRIVLHRSVPSGRLVSRNSGPGTRITSDVVPIAWLLTRGVHCRSGTTKSTSMRKPMPRSASNSARRTSRRVGSASTSQSTSWTHCLLICQSRSCVTFLPPIGMGAPGGLELSRPPSRVLPNFSMSPVSRRGIDPVESAATFRSPGDCSARPMSRSSMHYSRTSRHQAASLCCLRCQRCRTGLMNKNETWLLYSAGFAWPSETPVEKACTHPDVGQCDLAQYC